MSKTENMFEQSVLSYVVIPWKLSSPAETLSYAGNTAITGDCMPLILQDILEIDATVADVRVIPLKRLSPQSSPTTRGHLNHDTVSDDAAGLYAYVSSHPGSIQYPNVRATCLAMACGLHSRRFFGDVYISILGYSNTSSDATSRHIRNIDLRQEDIAVALVTPDLRKSVVSQLRPVSKQSSSIHPSFPFVLPCLLDAAKHNYSDTAMIQRLETVMQPSSNINTEPSIEIMDHQNHDEESQVSSSSESSRTGSRKSTILKENIVTVPLCLHCRSPSDTLCKSCGAAYFCDVPRTCRENCWSHQCICPTWSIYNQRRTLLSDFPFHPVPWHIPLLDRAYQLSEQPYKTYLMEELGVLPSFREAGDPFDHSNVPCNWWTTEVDGWIGGLSGSASLVDPSIRRSYKNGFGIDVQHPHCNLKLEWIPPERRVTDDEIQLWIKSDPAQNRNITFVCDGFHWIELKDWKDYYDLRGIPSSSPIALLCTFPLSIYYAIQQYGMVHLAVAALMKRALRVHIVGAEKEINFLDLFKEITFMLPKHVKVSANCNYTYGWIDVLEIDSDLFQLELVFIIRNDMLPPNCSPQNGQQNHKFYTEITLTENLQVYVMSGTYGNSIDPIWDCGTGSPDIVIGLNAGIFAYESWRDVVDFLNHNRNITGVFTDYNEHSGINCASLGGWRARESLSINPFRQPRAMPVFSMNLSQFSNGFMYVFNEQMNPSEY